MSDTDVKVNLADERISPEKSDCKVCADCKQGEIVAKCTKCSGSFCIWCVNNHFFPRDKEEQQQQQHQQQRPQHEEQHHLQVCKADPGPVAPPPLPMGNFVPHCGLSCLPPSDLFSPLYIGTGGDSGYPPYHHPHPDTPLPESSPMPPPSFHLPYLAPAESPLIPGLTTPTQMEHHHYLASPQAQFGISPIPDNNWDHSAKYDNFTVFEYPPSVASAPGSRIVTPPESEFDSVSMTGKSMNYIPKCQIKRHKMIYHCKFGEFGIGPGQFTEPSGVAVGINGDIVVADTNNHRIQVFNREGQFKFQFGECGKGIGQLLYPNRVCVARDNGEIIVTERSPTHQVQVFDNQGNFQRKFGSNVLQHPRGVCMDKKGRIIVIECKIMRICIFDRQGELLGRFSCHKFLEFPNGVIVNDREEIFISDNRAHSVKVFDYEGKYLRKIGGEGLTNFPIGVGLSTLGHVMIADNHNNFNLTVFDQDGNLISALESKVKHAQCFDVALMEDGSVVMASKDYRLYIYRYVHGSK